METLAELRREAPMETRAARARKEGRSKEESGSLVPVGRPSNESISQIDLDAQERIGKRGQAESEKGMGEIGEGNSSGESKRAREDEEEPDAEALVAMGHRRSWEYLYSGHVGSFEDDTEIPNRFLTDMEHPSPSCGSAMQVFSVKLKEIKRGLVWPLQVYGHIALRDSRDWKRNLIFNRGRDGCQTLTAKDQCLILTGPSRAVVDYDTIPFEIELKVKGNTQREDRILSSIVYEFNTIRRQSDCGKLLRETRSNKLSTVELTIAYLRKTVEATIEEVKVVEGSFGDYCPQFYACTNSLPRTRYVLLDPREGGTAIGETGVVKMTRSVVSVELAGKLKFTGEALTGEGKAAASCMKIFDPLKRGRSTQQLNFGFVKVSVRIAWSQFP